MAVKDVVTVLEVVARDALGRPGRSPAVVPPARPSVGLCFDSTSCRINTTFGSVPTAQSAARQLQSATSYDSCAQNAMRTILHVLRMWPFTSALECLRSSAER